MSDINTMMLKSTTERCGILNNILFSIILLIPVGVYAKKDDSSAAKTLKELSIKESQVVRHYSGFKVNADLVHGKTNMSVNYLDVIVSATPVATVSPYLIIHSNMAQADEQEVLDEMKALANFQPSSIRQTNDDFDKKRARKNGRDDARVRFDFLNESGRVRISEWRDWETGFKLQTAIYDNVGNLIGVDFYLFLDINHRDSAFRFVSPGELVNVPLDQSPKYRNAQFKNMGNLRDLAEDVLAKAFKKYDCWKHR